MSTRDEARNAVYKAIANTDYDNEPDLVKDGAHALLMLSQEDKTHRMKG